MIKPISQSHHGIPEDFLVVGGVFVSVIVCLILDVSLADSVIATPVIAEGSVLISIGLISRGGALPWAIAK